MKNNAFIAGLFILISFAIVIGLFFGITGSSLLKGPTRNYTAVFELTEDVGGLAEGSDVRVGGVKAGQVETVEVVERDGVPTVEVVFSLPEKFKVKEDARVDVQAGLTGLVNLNVSGLGTAQQLASESFRLDGRPSSFAAVFDLASQVGGEAVTTLRDWRPRVSSVLDDARPRVNGTLDQIRTTAASADETIRHVRTKIDPAYDKYVSVADNASGAMGHLSDMLGGAKGDFKDTVKNLSSATGTLNSKLPTIMDKANGTLDGLRGTLEKASVALEDVKAVAANTKDLTGSLRSVVTSNRSRFDEIIKSANLASQNLAAASAEIRRSPWRLLYKPSEGEVANQNLYDATRQFAEASRKLQDSSEALRDTLNDPDASKDRVQAILDKLNVDFANYQKVERTLWDRVKR